MSSWSDRIAVIRVRVLRLAMLAVTTVPALAQTPPPPAPGSQPNILRWPMPETVSPQGRALTTMMARAPVPDPLPPLVDQRRFADAVQASFGKTLSKRYAVEVRTSEIAGVPVRIVLPKGVSALGSGPLLLNLHGGGFTLDSGSLTETIPIAALTGIPVVAVLYRLAPEHAFPAAVDDALAVYTALRRDHPGRPIAVYGTSAGAGLSAQLVARLIAQHQPLPQALGFFSGMADFATPGDSESWQPLPNASRTLAEGMAGYVGKTPANDPLLSPLHSALAKFPPTLLVSSTRDILLSGTAIFGRALEAKGVDTRLIVFDGLPHAFWAYMDIPETREANECMARFLKAHTTLHH